MGLTIAQQSELTAMCGGECGGQLHSVKPWRLEDVTASRKGDEDDRG